MIGKTLSHYKILEQIGAGGMGVVYRAHDARLGRDVALKVLPADALGSESARRALENEARTASALNHPHICTIHDVGEADGQFFVAMEYVEGKPLARLIPAGGLPEEQVIRYGMQIADALAHAEQRGIVHRDLKSANVVITPEGRAKVLDFGLAQRVRKAELEEVTRSKVSIEASREIAGTLAYMAPETLRGETADARSDIWALGVMLYEMASGVLPFRGTTGFDLTSGILRDSPASLASRVSAGLANVIQHCLTKDPAKRYQRAGEVRVALEMAGTVSATQISSAVGVAASRRHWLWVLPLGLLAIAAVLVAFNADGLREKLFPGSAQPKIESIAVLPLDNLSGDPAQEYFADGMTEALISNLAQIRALRVISRTSVMRYKNSRKTIPEIARELHVDAVVEGSVQKAGERVRITAQLIRAATDTHLWAHEYERDLRDVLALQSEVARAIAAGIQVKLTPQEHAGLITAPAVRPEAYEDYLKGRYHWYKRSPDALKRSLEYFQQGIAKDPQYALAYAGLADSYNSLGWDLFAVLPPAQAFPKAKEAARKALEIDPRSAEAHAALGHVAFAYDWDWSVAEREFRAALELNPRYAPVHIWYSHFLEAMGRTQESLAESKRALESDPLGLVGNMHMGWYYLYVRQYDQAIEQLRQTLDLDPNFILAHMFLGETYEQKGMFQEAIAEFEKTIELSKRHPIYLAALGHGYAVAGRRDEALKVIEDLKRLSSRTYVPSRGIAEIHIGLGEKDQALAWLEKAFKERNGWLVHLRSNPRYDPLRSDPRFQALLERMKFPKEREK